MKWLKNTFQRTFPYLANRRNRTIRYAFPMVFVSLAVLGAAVITSGDRSYIRIQSSHPVVRANEQFSIRVFAYAHVPVNAVDVSLTFPEDQIKVLGIDTGESVITIWTEDPYVQGNVVRLSGGTYRRGFKGQHLIATINMRALETGQAEFSTENVRLLAGDGTGAPVASADSLTTGSAELIVVDANADDATIRAAIKVKIITDLDGDGQVTIKDISAFMAAWFNRSATYDFNGDGRMTFRDFSIILSDSFFK